jgi:hypothetical protein
MKKNPLSRHGVSLLRCLFLAANMSLGLTSLVYADTRHHALIVGVGQYSEASESTPLLGVPKDMEMARRMALAMGVPDSQIVELRDSQATKSNIVAALERLKQQVGVGERVFIYFSGHGTSYSTPKGCEQGVVPYTPARHTFDDVISETELATYTSKISEKADKAIVMIDACFSGGLGAARTRSISQALNIKPKFVSRAGDQCGVAINQPAARSFAPAMQRLGVPQQNFVQISAANHNEVSWDNELFGGLATHSLAQCLLGGAKDLDASGAITLEEVRQCAQGKLDALMAPHKPAGMLPSTIQIRGSRNLIVVAEPPKPVAPAPVHLVLPVVQVPPPVRPPIAVVTAPPVPPQAEMLVPPPVVSLPPPVSQPPTVVVTIPPAPAPQREEATPVQPPVVNALPPTMTSPAENLPPLALADQPIASISTLTDIFSQRNGKFRLDVSAPKQLSIGKDRLSFSVRSSLGGYLYVVLLGSDGKSFYLLFPNKRDQGNKIDANRRYDFPRPGWAIEAGGPEGTNQMLFVVSQSPRDPRIFVPTDTGGGGPFTFSVADLAARKRLVDFFIGRGVQGRNGQMAAALVKIEEVP